MELVSLKGLEMIPTYTATYRLGEQSGQLRIGWASWDKGRFQDRSIKWAYRDASGKVSRGCPELPFAVLVDMAILAYQQGELSGAEVSRLKAALAR